MRSLIHLLGCFLFASVTYAQQGVITGIQVAPDPACRNQETNIIITGTGQCQQVSLQADPNQPLQTISGSSFPITVPHTYDAAGTYTLMADSTHPNCAGGPVTHELIVESCGSVLAAEWNEHIYELLKPEISGGWGLVQPGNPFPIVVFGEKFGSQQGQILLQGDFGTVQLTPGEWGGDGKFAAGTLPEGICGVNDHEASIVIVTASGWHSDPWPVNFTAARSVAVVPRGDVQVLACSTDSNKDCCNNQCDPDDDEWFSAGCTLFPSICGTHYNVWAAIGNDAGQDRFRVDLNDGAWRIEGWDFAVDVNPSEGWASLVYPDAYQEKVGDFVVDWMVTPNDHLAYDVTVHMSGPCGTSHKAGFSAQALTSTLYGIDTMARLDPDSARLAQSILITEQRVDAAALRAAGDADQRARQELERLRAAVTPAAVEEARHRDRLSAEARELRLRAGSPAADRESLVREADALLERARNERSSVRD